MTENTDPTPQRPTVTATAGGITMTIDLHEMLTAIDPEARYLGYDPDAEEDHYASGSLLDLIAERTATHLAKGMRTEVKAMIEATVGDTIQSEVTDLIRAHLAGVEVQPTDEFGTPKGQPVNLTAMIVKAATDGLNKSDSYNGPTRLQKIITEAVGATFKRELEGAVKSAKASALQTVQDTAATVIRETIERSTRGL